jgi:signal transduction histidine kinase
VRVRQAAAGGLLSPEMVKLFRLGACVIIPLTGPDRLLGVVIVDNPETGREIGDDDLRFLQLFTNHVGVAIENSLLYSSIEEANQRLRETQDQLMHGERLATIGAMAAGIAHELKGPMVSIGGFARRLAKRIPPGVPETEYVATIIEEEQRLEKMLTDFLSFSKKTTICYERCAITDVLESALSIVAHGLEKSRVRVLRSFPRKPVLLYGDCQQLKQVFINLFYNAFEAMKEGGELRIAVSRTRINGGEGLAVKIADTGPGIPVAMLNSIFSPFITTKQSGTGLGLSIVNRIVSNHDGKIRVRNLGVGGGAEFTVILPCQG